MTKNAAATSATGFLTRLAHNEDGNILAIFAAAIIPVIGLIGGGVDMSRLYLTQARLQGACDAGALLGRKTMSVGSWDQNANTQALKMFDQNFESGAYGSNGLRRSFSEAGGNVTGTASATVPMALMQVLGIESKVVSVECQAELRIPNTDVMFVLDTTGSMRETLSGSTDTKITGLRRAVKCFYEALAKRNIADVSPQECGETVDPTDTNTGAVQLRFGFVPYAINVNVGRLLPHDYIANQWTYQSRVATMSSDTNASPIYGVESAPTVESRVSTNENNPGWVNTGQDVVQNGVAYGWYARLLPSQCDSRPLPSATNGPQTGARTLISQSPAPLVEPDSTLTKRYQQDTITANRTYRYFFSGDRSKTDERADCILQVNSTSPIRERVITATTTPVTWARGNTFAGWTYQPVTFNVSGLKNPATGAWNQTLSLPLGDDGANISVRWNGCIEERQTFRATDQNSSDDWDPIPASAFDMNIDMVPTADGATKWGPQLTSAVYARYLTTTNAQGFKQLSTTRTLDDVFISRNDGLTPAAADSNCPSEARILRTWTPGVFTQYVNDLSTGGTTYHDIGLLWGARLLSPTGIFANVNATPNRMIERHIVFMTDGETTTGVGDHTPYGLSWYDRRQTPASNPPNEAQLNALVDARTAALCKAIKGRNISLWVVSYGNVGDATNQRLEQCATPGKFFQAASVSGLVENFKSIAAEISALRITK